MANIVAQNRVSQVIVVLLIVEFAGVDTDHTKRSPRKSLFQILQVRNDVEAVDATIRPEIEQVEDALFQLERFSACVKPQGRIVG